ncbi:DUF4349 domain-containing protein [Bacillaceae bacterium S4-13-56]
MKKWFLGILIVLITFLVACSSEDTNESAGNDAANRDVAYNESEENTGSKGMDGGEAEQAEKENGSANTDSNLSAQDSNRKIIYEANVRIEVNDFAKAENDIQSEIDKVGGYMVESQIYGGGEDSLKEGRIKARIPVEKFDEFLAIVENGGWKLIEKHVDSDDVTEEYVDLESRLKSKKIVEERLLSFMQKAEKTEDLLKISNDLAKVQEEIEQITGRMKYLQNRSDLATITINIQENRVNIPSVKNEELNTWEKTQQQFMNSINGLLAFGSGLIVFFIGNLPVIILIAAAALIGYRIYKKTKKNSE